MDEFNTMTPFGRKLFATCGSVVVLSASASSSAQTSVSPVIVVAPHPKYQIDVPLRRGMVGVQNAVLAEYFAACANGPTSKEYLKLASALDRNADTLRLTAASGSSKVEVADLVDRLNKGSTLLRGSENRQAGVREAVSVLVDYATDFRHPGWHPRRASRGPGVAVKSSPGELSDKKAVIDEAAAARTERRVMCTRLADRSDKGWPWYLQ